MSLSRVENIFITTLLDQVLMRNKTENQTASLKSPNLIFVSATHEKVRSLGAGHVHYNTVTLRRRVQCFSLFVVVISFVRHLHVSHKVKPCF